MIHCPELTMPGCRKFQVVVFPLITADDHLHFVVQAKMSPDSQQRHLLRGDCLLGIVLEEVAQSFCKAGIGE